MVEANIGQVRKVITKLEEEIFNRPFDPLFTFFFCSFFLIEWISNLWNPLLFC